MDSTATDQQAATGMGASAAVPPPQPIPTTQSAAPAIDRRSRLWVTAALMLVMVLASMEATVTTTAMPTIIGELHGLNHYSWVASIYLLACTITMPLYGRLADVIGRKKTIIVAIILFTAGSVLAAYAKTMPQLILFRGAQGLGAGGIMPVVLTILGDLFTLEERARIQGAFSSVWGLSSLAGPALGAAIVHTLGWRWVFLVNLPFGVLGLIVLLWKYHDNRKPHSTALDLPGIALLAIASTSLLVLLSQMGSPGWSWWWVAPLALVSGVALFAFVWQEQRTENPVMPPRLMIRREIGPSILATFFFGAGFLCLDTYVPLYVQGGRGGGAAAAAAVVTPVMLAWAISNFIGAPALVRWGFRKVALVGCVLLLVGFVGLFLCAIFNAPRWLLTIVLAITGFGFGPASMSYLIGAQSSVEWQHRGIVTSSVTFFRTIGGAMGVGIMGAAFNLITRHDLTSLESRGVSPAAALDPHRHDLLAPSDLAMVRDAIVHGSLWIFGAMIAMAALQLAITFAMRGQTKPDHKPKASEGMA